MLLMFLTLKQMENSYKIKIIYSVGSFLSLECCVYLLYLCVFLTFKGRLYSTPAAAVKNVEHSARVGSPSLDAQVSLLNMTSET